LCIGETKVEIEKKEEFKLTGKLTLLGYQPNRWVELFYRLFKRFKLARKLCLEYYRRQTPIDVYQNHNLVVTVGLRLALDRLYGASGVNQISHCAVGSGTTEVQDSDEVIETPISPRIPITSSSRVGSTLTNETFFGVNDCNGTWGNCGIFNDLTGGTMFNHSNISPTKTKTTSITYIIKFEITASKG